MRHKKLLKPEMTTEELLATLATLKKSSEPINPELLRGLIDSWQIGRAGENLEGMQFNSLGKLNAAAYVGEMAGHLFREIHQLRTLLRQALNYIEMSLAIDRKALDAEGVKRELERVKGISQTSIGRDIFSQATVDLEALRKFTKELQP